MKINQVKKFWAIYQSKTFKKELKKNFDKLHLYAETEELNQRYNRKTVALILNRSPAFITKSLYVYGLFVKSLKKRKITSTTKINDLIIFIPKFKKLIENFKRSNLTVQNLLNLERFWEISIKGCGPKGFAYLLYCLEYQGLTISKAKWLRK